MNWSEVSSVSIGVEDNGDGNWTHTFTQQKPLGEGGKPFLKLKITEI